MPHGSSLLNAASFTLAYLDAGTGSMVFQWIVAGLLGGAFALRMSWRRIIATFSRKKPADIEDA